MLLEIARLARATAGITQIRVLRTADAPRGLAATGRGLEHERVADPGRRGDGVVEGVDPAPAPRGDRHADLLGDQLRADLVAQAAHRLAAGEQSLLFLNRRSSNAVFEGHCKEVGISPRTAYYFIELHRIMKDNVRDAGIEPAPQPWEGRVLPLN